MSKTPLTFEQVQAATKRAEKKRRFDEHTPCIDGAAYRAQLIAAGLLKPAPAPMQAELRAWRKAPK